MSHREQTPAIGWGTTYPKAWGSMSASEQPGSSIRRILVVEDDGLVGETIAAMLEGHYEAVLAETVEKALEHLQVSTPPDVKPQLILLDCLLPGNGMSRVLWAADQHPIPVVLISGDPERAIRIDPNRPFLPKPFNQAKLLEILSTAGR